MSQHDEASAEEEECESGLSKGLKAVGTTVALAGLWWGTNRLLDRVFPRKQEDPSIFVMLPPTPPSGECGMEASEE